MNRPCHGSSGQSLESPRGGPGSRPGSIHMGYVVDRVALGQGFLRLPSASIIPPLLHAQLSPPLEVSCGLDLTKQRVVMTSVVISDPTLGWIRGKKYCYYIIHKCK
jgi:hypothetical protein